MAEQTGPKIQRREKWVELPDEYKGFEVKIWVNAPTKLWTAIGNAARDEAAAQDAAQKIVIEHNGWLDFDGTPYPQPGTLEFWEDIPTELAGLIFALIQHEMGNLPNSIATQRRRSKRG